MQMAKWGVEFRLVISLSIQETLDSDLSSADAVRFKPMQFSEPNGTIEQTNGCRPLQFSPAASAIPLSQKSNNADAVAYGYPFDVDNIANDFELHQRPLYLRRSFMQERSTRRAGAMHAFDSINHFFLIGQMIIPGSSYWNIGIGRAKGEVEQDEEGLRTMEALGQNMAWLLKKINA